jgi:hypothetical protein
LGFCIEVDSKEIIGFDGEGEGLGGEGKVCTATAGEKDGEKEKCNSCFVCANGDVTFDCTNVAEGMIASTCQPVGIKLPTSFWEVISNTDSATKEATYPELDA